jgi:hypothetical protein
VITAASLAGYGAISTPFSWLTFYLQDVRPQVIEGRVTELRALINRSFELQRKLAVLHNNLHDSQAPRPEFESVPPAPKTPKKGVRSISSQGVAEGPLDVQNNSDEVVVTDKFSPTRVNMRRRVTSSANSGFISRMFAKIWKPAASGAHLTDGASLRGAWKILVVTIHSDISCADIDRLEAEIAVVQKMREEQFMEISEMLDVKVCLPLGIHPSRHCFLHAC